VEPPAAERGGFTVIELLIALVISGVVVGSIFQLISGHGRFVERQSAREEVQQNSRAALELIGSELRTVPAGDALVQATTDSVTIRAARAWGVVCAVGGATSLDVVLPVISGASYATNTGSGVVVNLGTYAAPSWSSAVPLNSVGGATSSCNGSALPSGVERRTLTLGATPQNADGTVTPAAGNILYIYDQVTYRSGSSSAVPGLWIQRRVGEGAGGSQPMAGPIPSGGLRFEFYAAGSSTPLSTPLSAAGRASVTRVAVVVEAVSRNSLGDAPESKADTVIVALRNRL
jgi:prepilin-type N-terminal cleavage/methylation domain-containing protein